MRMRSIIRTAIMRENDNWYRRPINDIDGTTSPFCALRIVCKYRSLTYTTGMLWHDAAHTQKIGSFSRFNSELYRAVQIWSIIGFQRYVHV